MSIWFVTLNTNKAPARSDRFCEQFGDDSLKEQLKKLHHAALTEGTKNEWQPAELIRGLNSARRKYIEHSKSHKWETKALPDLNP